MLHALIVDSDTPHALLLAHHLERAGYRPRVEPAGEAALAAACERRPDVVVTELSLPDLDGVTLLHLLRDARALPAALVVSRSDALDDKLAAFDAGADDYVVKPCAWAELLARVGAVVRRRDGIRADRAPTDLSASPMLGGWTVDPDARCARRHGMAVPLRPKEFALLQTLWERRGRVVTRAELLSAVWGYAPDTTTRTVDSHIFALRRKLEPVPERPRYIVTVSRAGYRLVA
jgi:two-component system KDP operon response regulator KdpE